MYFHLIDSYVSCIENESKAVDKYDGVTHLVEHPIQMRPPCKWFQTNFLFESNFKIIFEF